jgi:hypothetical protein
MSRLASLSTEAKRQLFSPDADSDLIVLVTFYDDSTAQPTPLARICDGVGFTTNVTTGERTAVRVSETANEVLYGVISNSTNYIYLPLQITLPSEEEAQAPRCSIVINDVTRYLTPIIRSLTKPPRVKLELVLSKTPNVVEVEFDYLYVTNISYNRDTVNCEVSMVSYEREPFPVHSFNPPNFPGLF